MRSLRRLAGLTPDRRRLVLRSLLVVVGVRVGLTALSFARLRNVLRKLERRTTPEAEASRPAVDELVWAVGASSRYVPRATCLVQALALELLLERSGRAAAVQIGVAKENGDLKAHAWVESEGRRLLEDSEPTRFASLPAGWQG